MLSILFKRNGLAMLVSVTPAALVLMTVIAASQDAFDAAAEIQRLEMEFFRSRHADLMSYISIGLAIIGVVLAVIAFVGFRSLRDVFQRLENEMRRVEDVKGDIEGLKTEAEDHLSSIEKVRSETDGWSSDIQTSIDDIADLKEALDSLQNRLVSDNPKLRLSKPDVADDDARDRMLDALANGPYRWRSIERLATIAGVETTRAADVLRPLKDEVVFSRGKSGRTIVRLKSRI